VLPSSKLPVAVNCWRVPAAREIVGGATEIEVRCAFTTVRVTLSLKLPTVAVIVVVPALAVVANPEEASILATPVADEPQLTPFTRS